MGLFKLIWEMLRFSPVADVLRLELELNENEVSSDSLADSFSVDWFVGFDTIGERNDALTDLLEPSFAVFEGLNILRTAK